MRALLLENVHDDAAFALRDAGFEVERLDRALGEDDLVAALPGVHVLGLRSNTMLTQRALAAAEDLLAVGAFCIGTNQIDLEAANQVGVPVFNAPFSNTRSVAELVICEVVMLARQLGDRSREVHEGKWRKVATNCFASGTSSSRVMA